jgi:predicted transcriptional regulator
MNLNMTASSQPLASLAKSELEIARIIWDLGGKATVREVFDALPEERELDFWTVQTYLRRLKTKGYLTTEKAGRNNVYRSAIRPNKVITNIVDDLVNRLFDGEVYPLVQHLVDGERLSDDDIQRLQTMLDEAKAKKA